MIQLRLAEDDKAALVDLALNSAGVKSLQVVIGALVRDFEERVLRYDLGSGDVQNLVALKSQAEGARKLSQAIVSHLEQIRMASLSAPVERTKRNKSAPTEK